MNLNQKQIGMLRHMLGLTDNSKRDPQPYRNYAAVEPGDLCLLQLEKLGMVEKCCTPAAWRGLVCYRCTEVGKREAVKDFYRTRYNKSRRRYLRFLSVSGCVPGLTFREFLTKREWAEIRANV